MTPGILSYRMIDLEDLIHFYKSLYDDDSVQNSDLILL